jgi:biotin carboxyl carrier protein
MKYLVTLGGRTIEVELLAEAGQVRVNGVVERAELRPVPGTPLRLLSRGHRSWSIPMENIGPGMWVVLEAGERHDVEVVDERTAHIRSLAGDPAARIGPKPLKAPMPGLVVRVAVEPGQAVAAGTSLVVLEAMKMENDLKAPAPGIVEKVSVLPGQTVEKGALLVSFRP